MKNWLNKDVPVFDGVWIIMLVNLSEIIIHFKNGSTLSLTLINLVFSFSLIQAR